MIDELFLHEKLATLSQYVDELRRIAARPVEEYERDLFVKRTGERTVELIVECAVDINNHLAFELSQRIPSEYYQSFLEAAACGVISQDLARRLAPTAGLRTRLAHEYEAIVDFVVYRSIQSMIPNYTEYIRQVVSWLQQQASLEEESGEQ